jgi:ribose-phosphate pyrophosphokinase
MPVDSPTTELSLPGLDVTPTVPETKPNHWIERGPQKRLMVFAGRSHSDLAQRIAEHLGVELGDVELKTFANDETYVRYSESIRGADVFIVQTGSDPVDRNLMELLLMIQAAKLASAKRITAVIPWFPYSRQDRKAKPRVPIFGRLFRDLGFTGEGVVSVAPDAGRAKVAVRFAEMLDAEFAVMHKTRPAHDAVAVTEITGRVRDKVAIVGDDVTTTGSTIIAGAQALKEHGAKDVWIFVTHALLNAEGLERLGNADVAGIVVTDTVPIDPLARPEIMTVLPVAGLLAETIMNVFADDSVSAIFGGDTQLF